MFIVYPITEIAEILDKGTTTIKSALNELDLLRQNLHRACTNPPKMLDRTGAG